MAINNYSILSARLMTCSTGICGSSFSSWLTTFVDGALANPSMVRAAIASSRVPSVDASTSFSRVDCVSSSISTLRILSLSSTMIRWAVLGPIPFMLLRSLAFPVAMICLISPAV